MELNDETTHYFVDIRGWSLQADGINRHVCQDIVAHEGTHFVPHATMRDTLHIAAGHPEVVRSRRDDSPSLSRRTSRSLTPLPLVYALFL